VAKGTACPCGLPRALADCCGRWHAGEPAPDAEALMRSRYSAYVLGLTDYLLATWHPDARPAGLQLDPPGTRAWLGLAVRAHRRIDDNHAEVEFVARSRVGGASAQRLHERSRFVRENGRWYYVDGDLLA
jgi:SEC-C motif domain protein